MSLPAPARPREHAGTQSTASDCAKHVNTDRPRLTSFYEHARKCPAEWTAIPTAHSTYRSDVTNDRLPAAKMNDPPRRVWRVVAKHVQRALLGSR